MPGEWGPFLWGGGDHQLFSVRSIQFPLRTIKLFCIYLRQRVDKPNPYGEALRSLPARVRLPVSRSTSTDGPSRLRRELGKAGGGAFIFTRHRRIHGQVSRSIFALTDYFHVTDLALHRIRVDLTHVPPAVGLPHLFDVEEPRAPVAMRHPDPVILRDDVVRYRQDRLGVHPQPGDLKSSGRNGYILEAVTLIVPRPRPG